MIVANNAAGLGGCYDINDSRALIDPAIFREISGDGAALPSCRPDRSEENQILDRTAQITEQAGVISCRIDAQVADRVFVAIEGAPECNVIICSDRDPILRQSDIVFEGKGNPFKILEPVGFP